MLHPLLTAALCVAGLMLPLGTSAMGLAISPLAQGSCTAPAKATRPLHALPPQAAERIPDSQAVAGQKSIAWAWLGSPTRRYPHGALGSPVHAGSVHALVKSSRGAWTLVEASLPLHHVFEDRVPRVVDLDQDGSEELLLIEADALRGASLVVLGVEESPDGTPRLTERARGPYAGSTFRWLNPVGVADFDGDGKPDVASVVTPHIGGVLQLLHYQPPALVPFARIMDVSNHRMGALEQELAVIVQLPGQRPTIIVPDMTRRALHALRWDAPGQWTEMADLKPLPGLVERLSPLSNAQGQGACATLADGQTLQVLLTH